MAEDVVVIDPSRNDLTALLTASSLMRYRLRTLMILFAWFLVGLAAIGVIEKLIGGWDYHGPSVPRNHQW